MDPRKLSHFDDDDEITESFAESSTSGSSRPFQPLGFLLMKREEEERARLRQQTDEDGTDWVI